MHLYSAFSFNLDIVPILGERVQGITKRWLNASTLYLTPLLSEKSAAHWVNYRIYFSFISHEEEWSVSEDFAFSFLLVLPHSFILASNLEFFFIFKCDGLHQCRHSVSRPDKRMLSRLAHRKKKDRPISRKSNRKIQTTNKWPFRTISYFGLSISYLTNHTLV